MSTVLGKQQSSSDDEEDGRNPESARPQEAAALSFGMSGMIFLHRHGIKSLLVRVENLTLNASARFEAYQAAEAAATLL